MNRKIEMNWIVIAGEEGGPKSNKMGGIWNVMDSEAFTMAKLIDEGEIENGENITIIVAGPYYGFSGSDWNSGLDRVTDLSGLDCPETEKALESTILLIRKMGISVKICSKKVGQVKILYLLFDTSKFNSIITYYDGQEMTLSNRVKKEAYELFDLDSLNYERMGSPGEYTHYLNLSYAISEFVRVLITSREEEARKYEDEAISEFAISLIPRMCVSLHSHEFGTFYAIARLEKIGIPVRTLATFHATIPGRAAGYRSINKIMNNDSTFDPNVNKAFAMLESLASYADNITAVGDSTKNEIRLFYKTDAIIVRNGIETVDEEIDWDKKKHHLEKIQNFLSNNLYNYFDSEQINPENIVPIFTISRTELENKGYPDLLDSLVVLNRLMKHHILSGRLNKKIRIVCFLITAHGPKEKNYLPQGFPINLPIEILVGEELRLNQMIRERDLQCENLSQGKRMVSAVLYPQWLSEDDGGLNMTPEQLMSGCVAGIFPSKYDPYLLTGLEAGAQATPGIVSRVCGFSDALSTSKKLVEGMGGIVVVDNIELSHNEMIVDYALALDYFISTFIMDKVKYSLLCQEAYLLAKEMNWTVPIKQYYEILTGIKT